MKRALNADPNNTETWGSLGYCYLMTDDLEKAYAAYQRALYHLPSLKDPNLWYGIGILYDRYGSYEHAEEAFSAVLKMVRLPALMLTHAHAQTDTPPPLPDAASLLVAHTPTHTWRSTALAVNRRSPSP